MPGLIEEIMNNSLKNEFCVGNTEWKIYKQDHEGMREKVIQTAANIAYDPYLLFCKVINYVLQKLII